MVEETMGIVRVIRKVARSNWRFQTENSKIGTRLSGRYVMGPRLYYVPSYLLPFIKCYT